MLVMILSLFMNEKFGGVQSVSIWAMSKMEKNELFERPILVLKKFNNKIAWVLPMSAKPKDGIYYHSLEHEGKKIYCYSFSA